MGRQTIKHRAIETRSHRVSSYKEEEVWVHVLQRKGLAMLNNNPYPLQQTRSKAPEKTKKLEVKFIHRDENCIF